MITVKGTLCDYCENCPYMDLEAIAHSLGGKYYVCANRELCARLWEYLQHTTSTTITTPRG